MSSFAKAGKRIGVFRILHVTPSAVWASRGARLFRGDPHADDFTLLADVPLKRHWFSRFSLGERLARAGIHDLVETSPSSALLIVTGAIARLDNGRVTESLAIERGSRPLSLTRGADGAVYFGEYWANAERAEVRVMVTEDSGAHWEQAYVFPKGKVRHVHRIVADPGDARTFYVCTGDLDSECGIFVTRDRFATLNPLLSGSQQSRALAVLLRRDGLYFATDTPEEQNYIKRLSLAGEVTEIGPISSSGFHCCAVGETMYFATAVEPSAVNTDKRARMYSVTAGGALSEVGSAKKDPFPKKLFQYGTFILPSGPGDGAHLWTTPWAVRGHGQLRRYTINE